MQFTVPKYLNKSVHLKILNTYKNILTLFNRYPGTGVIKKNKNHQRQIQYPS